MPGNAVSTIAIQTEARRDEGTAGLTPVVLGECRTRLLEDGVRERLALGVEADEPRDVDHAVVHVSSLGLPGYGVDESFEQEVRPGDPTPAEIDPGAATKIDVAPPIAQVGGGRVGLGVEQRALNRHHRYEPRRNRTSVCPVRFRPVPCGGVREVPTPRRAESEQRNVTEQFSHRDEVARFRENRAAWEDWSGVDPLWSIVTASDKGGGAWELDAFFSSGQATIDALWQTAAPFGLPRTARTALDFGCGVGRLTRALGSHVEHVLGLDISQGMVDLARRYNAGNAKLVFDVHHEADLHRYADGAFDVVCCLLVLQHIPSVATIERYLGELVRVLAPGGLLMLQLTTNVRPDPPSRALRALLRPRTRLAQFLHGAGVSAGFLHRHLGWRPPMPMVAIPEDRACELLAKAGATVRWTSTRSEHGVDDCLYLASRDDS